MGEHADAPLSILNFGYHMWFNCSNFSPNPTQSSQTWDQEKSFITLVFILKQFYKFFNNIFYIVLFLQS